MFRKRGTERTFRDNLLLAILLSLTAGAVNVVGLFTVGTQSGNVTGYITHFAEHLSSGSDLALRVGLFAACFWMGAFTSTSIFAYLEYYYKQQAHSYQIPLHLEILMLLGIWYTESHAMVEDPIYVSCLLLFSMGLQNALITNISGAVVRPTHMSGTVTDLAINTSFVLFHPHMRNNATLHRKLILHSSLLGSFILGGFLGGLLYHKVGVSALLFPIGLLEACAITSRLKPKDLKELKEEK